VCCGQWTLAGILPSAKTVGEGAGKHLLTFVMVNMVE